MMRMLSIDDVARAKVKRVVDHATKPENYYLVSGEKHRPVPGDDPRHVAALDTYRFVFSMTKADSGIYRHLSVSVPGRKFAHPMAVLEIARLFGFEGWDGEWRGEDSIKALAGKWMIEGTRNPNCIVVAQKVCE